MLARVLATDREEHVDHDHVVHLRGLTWDYFERVLEMRGEHSAPRVGYLDGVIEIMSPSRTHEGLKSFIGCLIEAYCLERGVDFSPYGGWNLKDKPKEAGAEPDECYIFHGEEERERPHLAVEVHWTSGRIDKLRIDQRLGVPEVWYWRRGVITIYALRGEGYEPVGRSRYLPGLDPALVAGLLDRPTASQAIWDLRAALAEGQE